MATELNFTLIFLSYRVGVSHFAPTNSKLIWMICKTVSCISLNATKQGKEHTDLVDVPIEVTVTELRPKFCGSYSDVYIGRFGDKIVRLHGAP
jgi:hypothetical protein